jgi:hypothetical protein
MFAAGVLPGRSISFLSDFVSVAYPCHATPRVAGPPRYVEDRIVSPWQSEQRLRHLRDFFAAA